jgi:hypothetical protein
MRSHQVLFIGLALVATYRSTQASPQVSETSQIAESIDVKGNRPIAEALKVLEKRYGFAITYEDPVYSNPSDLQDVTASVARSRSEHPSRRKFALKEGEIHFQYAIENGKPVEDTRSLIRRMLDEYAGLGNPKFDVQERATKFGPEWHVFPTEVRTVSGALVQTTALLDNIIYIPKQKRTYNEMFGEILEQVSNVSGYRIMLGYYPMNYFLAQGNHEAEYGADHRPARDVLAELLGPSFVWQLSDVPGENKFVMDITIKTAKPLSAPPPQRFSPLDESGHLINQNHVSREEAYEHPSMEILHHSSWSKEPVTKIQVALAHAGFYHGEPTGTWDSNTRDAMRMFQSANNLPASGNLDAASLRKLGVTLTPFVPASNPNLQE